MTIAVPSDAAETNVDQMAVHLAADASGPIATRSVNAIATACAPIRHFPLAAPAR